MEAWRTRVGGGGGGWEGWVGEEKIRAPQWRLCNSL